MDKVTPKSADVFKANLDRVAPLLAKVKADGIGHLIDGKVVPSISGQTFETQSPVDGAVLAQVAISVRVGAHFLTVRWTSTDKVICCGPRRLELCVAPTGGARRREHRRR